MNKEINNYNKRKMIILTSIVSLVLILMGSTYAFFSYSKSMQALTIESADISALFTSGSNAITFDNAYPISDEFAKANLEKLTYIDFTVSSEVTREDTAVEYQLYLTEVAGNTLSSDYIKVYLLDEQLNEVTKPTLYSELENTTYQGAPNGKVIYKDNNTGIFTRSYRLYVWLDKTYTQNEVSQSFTFKVNLYAYNVDYVPTAVDILKGKVGTGGLVAINQDGTLYNGTGTIREYRYSGPTANNYVFFDTNGDGNKTDNEIWRIVGIFKDTVKDSDGNIVLENGQPTYEEKVKLMRNTVLTSAELPATYTINGTANPIEYSTTGTAYWNYRKSGTNYNDWTTAGLQYYLNTEHDESETPNQGYLSFLSTEAKDLLSLTTYHLGNVVWGSSGDTAISAYDNERGTVECASSVTTNSNESNCNIWYGNQPNWNGYVGLLYPSDYGYSATNTYWTTALYSYDSTAKIYSWMQQTANHSIIEWFLSPSSDDANYAMIWTTIGRVGSYSGSGSRGARGVINLISSATVLDAAGTIDEPYIVVVE